MAGVQVEERQLVLTAIDRLSGALNKMVQDGRKDYKEAQHINDFVKSHGKEDLHGLLKVYPVQLYVECFKSLGVASRKELENLWNRYEGVRHSVEELLAAEEGYKAFVGEMDAIMNAHEEETALPVVPVGAHLLQTDAGAFPEARSGIATSLNSLLKKCAYTLFVLRKHYV